MVQIITEDMVLAIYNNGIQSEEDLNTVLFANDHGMLPRYAAKKLIIDWKNKR